VSPRCVMVHLPWKHVERLATLSAENCCRLVPCSLRPTRSPWAQRVLLPVHAAPQTCTGAKPMFPDQLQALAARTLVRASRQPRRTALVPSLFFSPFHPGRNTRPASARMYATGTGGRGVMSVEVELRREIAASRARTKLHMEP